jgi:uncharacterized protein YceK
MKKIIAVLTIVIMLSGCGASKNLKESVIPMTIGIGTVAVLTMSIIKSAALGSKKAVYPDF